jgi:hypothetical protein
VKSAFDSISKELVEGPNLHDFEASIFHKIWKSPTPSKVVVFLWKLLYDRIPTKENLLLRGIIQQGNGSFCVWCGDFRESSIHLMLHSKVAMIVWYEIFKWLIVVIVMAPNLFYLFDCLIGATRSKKERKGFVLVWHSTLWCIWRAQNFNIFRNLVKSPLEVVEEVKVLSWRWSVDRLNISPCLFYEWAWDPGDCFSR